MSMDSHLPKCKHQLCRTRLTLSDRFECQKCHNTFCSFHRVFEAHECPVFTNEQSKPRQGIFSGEFSNYEKFYKNSLIHVR